MQLGFRSSKPLGGFVEDLVVRVEAYRMMDHHIILLHPTSRLTHNMDDFDLFSHGSGDAVQSTEFAFIPSALAHSRSADDSDTHQHHV